MPPAAYAPVEADLLAVSLHRAGRHEGRRILAPHLDLLSNSFPRGSFLVTAARGRHAESTRCGAVLSRASRAPVTEDRHHA